MSLSLSLSLYLSLSIFLVMSCLLITLNKCLKGHKSLGLLLKGVLKMSLSLSFFLVMSCLLITLNFVVGLSFCITITGIARTSVAAVTKCRWKTFWQSIEMIGNVDCKEIKLSGKNPKCQTGRNKSTTFWHKSDDCVLAAPSNFMPLFQHFDPSYRNILPWAKTQHHVNKIYTFKDSLAHWIKEVHTMIR